MIKHHSKAYKNSLKEGSKLPKPSKNKEIVRVEFSSIKNPIQRKEIIKKLTTSNHTVFESFLKNQTKNSLEQLKYFLSDKLKKHKNVLKQIQKHLTIKCPCQFKEYEKQNSQIKQKLVEATHADEIQKVVRIKSDTPTPKKTVLLTSFKKLNDLKNKADFVFELLDRSLDDIEERIKNQNIEDIYYIIKFVESNPKRNIDEDGDKLIKMKSIMQITTMLEQKLIVILKKIFVSRLKSSLEYKTIKSNAKKNLKLTNKSLLLKSIKKTARVLLGTDDKNEYVEIFEQHLRYIEKNNHKIL